MNMKFVTTIKSHITRRTRRGRRESLSNKKRRISCEIDVFSSVLSVTNYYSVVQLPMFHLSHACTAMPKTHYISMDCNLQVKNQNSLLRFVRYQRNLHPVQKIFFKCYCNQKSRYPQDKEWMERTTFKWKEKGRISSEMDLFHLLLSSLITNL